jgi:hypothetical protein
MWDQEKKHLAVLDMMQVQHRIRPTILSEAAKLGGFGLGAATALMGKEAAMACTEAVETVIGEHYDEYDLPLCILTHTFSELLQSAEGNGKPSFRPSQRAPHAGRHSRVPRR